MRIARQPPIDGATIAAFWQAVALDPSAWSEHALAYRHLIGRAGTSNREDLRRTLNWFEAAVPVRDRTAMAAAGRLLAAMPETLLASDYARLMTIFNSRVIGMAWRITADLDVKPLPPRIPRFGEEAGFGMVRKLPELYAKLALLGPEMEEVVIRLASEALQYGISLPDDLSRLAQPPAARG